MPQTPAYRARAEECERRGCLPAPGDSACWGGESPLCYNFGMAKKDGSLDPSERRSALRNPVPDRLRRRFKLRRQLLRRTAGMHQFHHLAAERGWVGNLVLAIVGSLDANGPVSTKPGQLQSAL